MSSVLTPATWVVTWIFLAIHLVCGLGFMCSRNRAVFAIRVPEVVLACMVSKFVCFVLLAWLFLDASCPCAITTLMLIVEFTGNFSNLLRKTVLLFRYEIQATLETSKQVNGVMILDERNFFVRYRHILRVRGQLQLIGCIFIASAIGFVPLIFVFFDEARRPCITESWRDNRLSLWNVILIWVYFVPVMLASLFLTRKLKAFPKDNWRMGTESTFTASLAVVEGATGIAVLVVIPSFEGILFLFFCYTVVLQLLNYLVPLQLHRKTVRQLAQTDFRQLTSLARLLKDPGFVEAFGNFLKSEFSSEHLAFWMAIEKIKKTYKTIIPADCPDLGDISTSSRRPHFSTSRRGRKDTVSELTGPALVKACIVDCVYIGKQYIGDRAPWQINIAGDTVKAVEFAVQRLNSTSFEADEAQAKAWLDDGLKCLVTAQLEVYESLRKDPYPRFLLSPASDALNQSENFKRLLAAEKLEEDVQPANNSNSDGAHSRSLSSDDVNNAGSRRATRAKRPSIVADAIALGMALSPRGRPISANVIHMSTVPEADTTTITRDSQSPRHSVGSRAEGSRFDLGDDLDAEDNCPQRPLQYEILASPSTLYSPNDTIITLGSI